MILTKEIIEIFPEEISLVFRRTEPNDMQGIQEIRLRANKPLMIVKNNSDFLLG
ncbi:hypothetical protein [Caloramator sp. Dgby_cultured_2]|uniref:hypothetical protein n=1 Tax=Caloramator sp. Dgby_cultured_2 TaxID=3029174 RepID=UPI00237DBDEB|nr:hypothetical protein [Caloramator sp. Dgby_cultured_2]WDU84282.1 hypothetical protein PWK10_08275 [Caloramator sp. Dgby_cultured_2]